MRRVMQQRVAKMRGDHRTALELIPLFRQVASLPEVERIITGPFTRSRSTGRPRMDRPRRVQNGIRYIASADGVAQTVIVVTSNPDVVEQKISLMFLDRN